MADCLNAKGFLVQGAGTVRGQSPSGIAFSVRGTAIDDSGNPGGARLTPAERRTVRSCVRQTG